MKPHRPVLNDARYLNPAAKLDAQVSAGNRIDTIGVVGATAQLLAALGQDLSREGLKETPTRVAKYWAEFLNPAPFTLTTFENEGTDEMVVQTGIPFYSLCEHHLLPFFGTATVAYIPKQRIVGLSKLARTVRFYAQGLQNQERITKQAADLLESALDPLGVAVILTGRHLCMEMRGVKTHEAATTTSDLRGYFKDDSKARSELFRIAHIEASR